MRRENYTKKRIGDARRHDLEMMTRHSDSIRYTLQNARVYNESWNKEYVIPESSNGLNPNVYFLQNSPIDAAFTCIKETERLFKYCRNPIKQTDIGKIGIVFEGSFCEPCKKYQEGKEGPETYFCEKSALFPVLSIMRDRYYDGNEDRLNDGLMTSRAFYLPRLVAQETWVESRYNETKGKYEKPEWSRNTEHFDVIVCSSPNKVTALLAGHTLTEVHDVMTDRIDTIMKIAMDNNIDTLVIGAFGCEENNWSYVEFASILRDWVIENGSACSIKNIVVAQNGYELRSIVDTFEEGLSILMNGLANFLGYINTNEETILKI